MLPAIVRIQIAALPFHTIDPMCLRLHDWMSRGLDPGSAHRTRNLMDMT